MLRILLPLLLMAGFANAAQPIFSSFRDFSGGLNNYSAPTSIAANESPNLQNVVIDEPLGALTQRNGYQTCGTIPSGATATNLYEYVKNDGSRQLIATDNNTIWATSDCIIYSTVVTGWGTLNLPRFATIQDKLWIVNGSTYPYVWDGTSGHYLDGSSTYPTAPKAKYIAYWKSRVWLANTPTAPSSVFFSTLVDSLGNIVDPALSTAAWNSTDQIYVNRGEVIYGIKPYRDNLYVFGENYISRIIFESEYEIAVQKNVSTIGSKFQESIVEQDDSLLRFIGRDGLYAFDGSTVKRISTKWTPTFETFKQPTRGEQYKLWDTSVDYLAGSFTRTATSYLDGSISLYPDATSRVYDTFSNLSKWTPGNGANLWAVVGGAMRYVGTGSGVYDSTIYTATTTLNWGEWKADLLVGQLYLDGYWSGNEVSYYFVSNSSNPSVASGYSVAVKLNGNWNKTIELRKVVNGAEQVLASSVTVVTPIFLTGLYYYASTNSITVGMDGSGLINILNGSQLAITYTDPNFSKGASTYNIFRVVGTGYFGTVPLTLDAGIDNVSVTGNFSTSGSFYSQVSTFTSLSQWRTFGADDTRNGYTVNYYVRTSPTVNTVPLATWVPITAGAVVSTTTDGFAQWRADLATTDTSVTPLVNSVSMGWATGDTSKSVIGAVNYKSRYWLTGSTAPANNYNDIVIVESKSPLGTFTKHDLPVSALTLWNGNLYGSISNTAKIARLDFGSTDDGAAINSYWESRDEVYENPVYYKTINVGVLDYSNSPANTGLSVGISPDQGATYQDRTIDLSASTLSRNTVKLNWDANTALGFRTRISNSVLGIGFKIFGVYNAGTMLDFYGQ